MQKESQVVEIRPDDIVLEEEIGRGSFAQVYRGKCRGQTVAIKVLHTQTYTEQVLQAFREEIAVMSQIHHPNLVLFMGACTIPGKLMIVTELMPRNLESVFLGKAGKHKRVTLVQKIKMAKDAALGMNWLHKSTPMFIHRDFKLSNLLVDENYNVKVCDFGLTKMKQANDNLHDDSKGSPLYMAPEVFTGSYSEKCDVYSFGLSFWEIINERRVFPRYENNLQALIKSRCENYETPPITDDMLPRLVSLLKRCWDKNPRLRPSFDVVVKELEEIIIEQCITDERGREVWKKASKGEDKMTWDDLARAVCISVGKVALAESYRSDRQMQCLKVLLCRQSEPNTVHAEKFGKVLAWFGPFFDGRGGDAQSRGRTFLDRIEETLSMKWFHGELSTQDAEERLDNRRPGTFLVRFSSSEKGAFTVSGVDRDRKKSHQRLIYHPNKGLYVMPDETIYTSLIDAINDLCRASKLRHPCPGSRYAKYFSEEPQPTSKNIALVKEEIKQLQLIHLNEICEVPDKDISLDTTIDTASIAGRPWGGHHQLSHHHQFASGPLGGTRSPFHTGNMSIHSSGTWGGGGGGGGSGVIGGDSDSDAIRIAPYIPPLNSGGGGGGGGGGGSGLTSPYNTGGLGGHHSSGPSSSSAIPASVQAALAANKAATSAATAAAYRQSPYTHASKYPNLTYSPHPLNSAELYYSAPMPGMKSTSSSSFSFSQFASTKHPFRSKDVLTAPLKSEEKKRGLFSRLKRGVTGGKDKDKDHHRDGDRDDGSDLSDSSVSSTWSGKSGGKMLGGKGGGNNSGGGGGKKSGKKGKKDKKDSSLNRKGHASKEDKDFGFHGEDHGYHRGSGGGGGGGDNGGGTSDDDSLGMYGMSPYVVPSVTADSTTASTNSIPAHVLCTLQKAEDERIRKRINGNYDSDSSTEDLFPPYQPSSSTSSSSSYIKRAAEEKSRHLHHLVGGKEMQEQEEEQEEDDDRDDDDEEEEDEENESTDDEDESSGEEEAEDSDDEEEEEKAKAKKQKKGKRKEEEEEKKKQKKSKAKESSRAHKEDKERRREKKHHHHSTKSSSSERRKEEREASISTSPSGKEAKRRTKQPHIPITFVARPSSSGSAAPAPMSLAATAPPGFMEAALLSAPRARRERKPERSARKVTTNDYGNGNGRAKADGGEEEGLRLDQVVSPPAMKTSTSPTSTLTVGGLDGNSHREHRKKKKSRGSKGDGGSPASTGDEAETMTATSSSSPTKKEKKSKKDKSGKGVKEALQRRQQRAPTSASSDLTTGGEEDETSEKEQNDPQGKKKKKDEERTVIAVF